MKTITAILMLVFLFSVSCKRSIDDKRQIENYEKGTLTLKEIETKNPENFLAVSLNDKKNLLGQTVIKGVIINHGKIVTYNDISVKLFFFSKTGALLEEDQEVIYETVEPGASKRFKSKYFAAKGTDSVAIKIMGATASR